MRIEKGHVSGPELDGRTTLHDLGFAGLASAKKPFVGSVMLGRDALAAADRPRLIGLRSLDGAAIRSGAHLVGGDRRSQGHVTSATYSPQLGCEIALALLERGPERLGERVTATYPLRDSDVAVEVVSPHFVDPEGTRLHG